MTKCNTPTKRAHSISDWGEGMTKQSFKDECNINKIMEKFQRTGILNHYTANAPQYMDIEPLDYHQAMNIIAEANSMFEELPAIARAKFNNDPETFLEYVQDPQNKDELPTLGLALKPSPVQNTASQEPKTESASAPSTPSKGEKPKDD